jgi:hypothetical protein
VGVALPYASPHFSRTFAEDVVPGEGAVEVRAPAREGVQGEEGEAGTEQGGEEGGGEGLASYHRCSPATHSVKPPAYPRANSRQSA